MSLGLDCISYPLCSKVLQRKTANTVAFVFLLNKLLKSGGWYIHDFSGYKIERIHLTNLAGTNLNEMSISSLLQHQQSVISNIEVLELKHMAI